jgi:hypothetical protein
MVLVEYVPAFHPDVEADHWERGQGVRIGRTTGDCICLGDSTNTDRLDDEVAQLYALIGGHQEIRIGGVEGQEYVEVAVGFGADRGHRACDPDA